MDNIDGSTKPFYCHWDSHEQDVFFTNENELDQHLYSHFQKPPMKEDFLVDGTNVEVKPPKNIECHWDTCHEMFDIDEIMEHFRSSHQEESFHPHHGNCASETTQCLTKPDPSGGRDDSSMGAFVRMSNSGSNNMAGVQPYDSQNGASESQLQLDPASLPTLDTPESLPLECHRCMWCSLDGHICGEEFMTSTELNAHIVHNHLDTMVCEWTGCEREREPFGQRQKLVRHLQTHAKALDYKCKFCSKTLCSDSQLKLHERHHTQEKPFKCTMCEKAFKSRNSLMVHTRTHTGAKPLCCPFPGCGKRFAESSNLAKHRRIHEKPKFRCPECNRMFTRKDHLLRHMNCKKHIQSHRKHNDHMVKENDENVDSLSSQMHSQMHQQTQSLSQQSGQCAPSNPTARTLALSSLESQVQQSMPVLNTQPHSQDTSTPTPATVPTLAQSTSMQSFQPKPIQALSSQACQYPAMPYYASWPANVPSPLASSNSAQPMTPPYVVPSQQLASVSFGH